MIWVAWRQHRGELIGALALLAGLAILLMTHGVAMHDAYERLDMRACQLRAPFPDEPCVEDLMSFNRQYANVPEQFAVWLPFLPMVAGMLIGAPMLAREFEQGTWQLAWTQGVTRARWLASQLAAVFGFVLVASVAFAAGVTWWFEPLGSQQFSPEKFNHTVLIFPGYVGLGVAIGVLAGVLFRRVIVAAAVTIPAYLALRLSIEFGLRPRYREPLTTDDPGRIAQGWPIDDITMGPGDRFPTFRYHPDDRFWQFQVIETVIIVVIAVILLSIAWRLVVGRRPSARRTARRPAMALSHTSDGDV